MARPVVQHSQVGPASSLSWKSSSAQAHSVEPAAEKNSPYRLLTTIEHATTPARSAQWPHSVDNSSARSTFHHELTSRSCAADDTLDTELSLSDHNAR
jgi:hypothetical protein